MVTTKAEMDEANRHGYVRAPELNGTHVGKALWDFDDSEWREIIAVRHDRDCATVTTVGTDAIAREHLSTEQSFDISAHPYRTTPTEGASE
jgi:hypothetical protein